MSKTTKHPKLPKDLQKKKTKKKQTKISPQWENYIWFKENPCEECKKVVGKQGRDIVFDESKCTCKGSDKNWYMKCQLFKKGTMIKCDHLVAININKKDTSNLSKHFNNHHPEKVTIQTHFVKESNLSTSFNDTITKLCSMGKMSTSVVKEPLFKQVISLINERLPSTDQIMLKCEKSYRQSITLLSQQQKFENKKRLKELIDKDTFICLASDETPINGKKMYAIILYLIQSTGEMTEMLLDVGEVDGNQDSTKVENQINETLAFYDIKEFHAFVGDGAAYNPKASKNMNVPFYHCIVHVLNLLITDLIKCDTYFNNLLLKLNAIRRHFTTSPEDMNELNRLSKLKLSLKSYSRTRFTSSYNCIKSFLLRYDGITKFQNSHYQTYSISEEEWCFMYRISQILKIISETSTYLSGTSTPTRDCIVFLLKHIMKRIDEIEQEFDQKENGEIIKLIENDINNYSMKRNTPSSKDNLKEDRNEINEKDDEKITLIMQEDIPENLKQIPKTPNPHIFWKILKISMNNRLKCHIENIDNLLSLYVSPLFRELFMTMEERKICREFISKNGSLILESGKQNFEIKRSNVPFKESFIENITQFQLTLNESSELDIFERDKTTDSCQQYWSYENNQKKFPTLFQIYRKYCCIPSSSIGVERVFSSANNTLTKRNQHMNFVLLTSKVHLQVVNKQVKFVYK